MNNELLLLDKKHTDTLIQQTKTKPQETLELKMDKQMQTFSFNSPINFAAVGKWLLAVTSFEVPNSVFNITVENNSFSITIPGHWNSKSVFLTQSYSGPLGDLGGYIQLIPGTYKSDRPIIVTSLHKVHLKCDCIQGSVSNGIREPVIFGFALDQPPGHKTLKEPRIKLFKKINKSVLTHHIFFRR